MSPEELEAFHDFVAPAMREAFLSTLSASVACIVDRAIKEHDAAFAERERHLEAEGASLEALRLELAQDREALRADSEALDAEKLRMVDDRRGDDILTINIGGEKQVAVHRSTLCLVEPSMLASSFSGRWDDSLPRDKDGNFFIDADPELFMPLLAYLRAKRLEDPTSPLPAPGVPGREHEFHALLKFYGLESILPKREDDVLTINIGGEKQVAVHRSTLCSVEPSKLASSFSGCRDDSLPRDRDGNFFIDADPGLVMPLLACLRAKRMEDPASPAPPPCVPAGRQPQFQALLRFYGLQSLMPPRTKGPQASI